VEDAELLLAGGAGARAAGCEAGDEAEDGEPSNAPAYGLGLGGTLSEDKLRADICATESIKNQEQDYYSKGKDTYDDRGDRRIETVATSRLNRILGH
jgi:hypothetical protein